MTARVNGLIYLQDKQQNILQLLGHIEALREKLLIFFDRLWRNDLAHFPSCRELMAENIKSDFSYIVSKTESYLLNLKTNLETEKLKPCILLFNNPMEVNVRHSSPVFCYLTIQWKLIWRQLPELQLEVCELQFDSRLLSEKNANRDRFWKLVCKDRFPKLRDFALNLHSTFGITNICQSTFSTMKEGKSKTRNLMKKYDTGCLS